MTQDQYNRLNAYRQTLDDIVIHRCLPNGGNNVLRAIDAIYHEIMPSAPTNFSCPACIEDMIKTSRNLLIQFEKP